jgi:hypothetical protein
MHSRRARPQLHVLEDRVLPSAYVVTTTADSGAGSLRDAITQINADTSHVLYASPSNPSVDEIDFDITAASDTAGGGTGYNAATGVATITPLSGLPAITNAVLINGYTQPGASANTLSLGDNAVLKIQLDGVSAGAGVSGLNLSNTNVTVKGLDIVSFSGAGIDLFSGGNFVLGNFIGTDATSTTALGNGHVGVNLGAGATNNTIGGTTAAARNVISGNTGAIGVIISAFSGGSGVAPTGNVLECNFIGIDASGTHPLANRIGVIVESSGNTIGGTIAGAGNVVSGNASYGIQFDANGIGNLVEGNYVGTDGTGEIAVGNIVGGIHDLKSGNTLGGTTPGAGNVLSGNGGAGLDLDLNAADVIQGNYIGTDAKGTAALGNDYGILGGVVGGAPATIGGTAPCAGNVISGNGIGILTGSSNQVFQGNRIGTDYTGTMASAMAPE